MINNHWTNYLFIVVLLIVNIIDSFIHINPAFLTVICAAFLVYVGCLFGTKVFCTEDVKEEVETMKSKDALMFPIIGSCVLFGLFILFKYLNKDYLNILFLCYFSFVGTYSISAIISEKLGEKKRFKKYYEKILFTIPKIPVLVDSPVKVTQLDIFTFLLSSVVGILYFKTKHWLLNNIIGMGFCIFGIENLMIGQYKNGLILLGLLFFYDIFWVFFTPVMVTVARNLDGPVKLIFPKILNPKETKDFNMIGLGDIVVPGVYIALMLRFDLHLFSNVKKNDLKTFTYNFKNAKYFFITFISYILGLISTLIVMYYFNHAQPALLYLVPYTLISSTVTSFISGDFKELWKFNEEKIGKDEEVKDEKNERDDDDDKKQKRD